MALPNVLVIKAETVGAARGLAAQCLSPYKLFLLSVPIAVLLIWVVGQYGQSLIQHGACAPPDSKMGTEVVGTLTHAGAPQRSNAPHSAPHPACVYNAL
jgi:hypothetical protein